MTDKPTQVKKADADYINPDSLRILKDLVSSSQAVLVLQPDSPDGDSLGSALGLEEILSDLGKQVYMYSYKEPETYLRGQEGWDRVSQNFPSHFDFTILVDTGAPALIKSVLQHHQTELTSKPMVIIDHHISRTDMGFATTDIVPAGAAAAEVITHIAEELNWPINERAAAKLATALLSDSLNLTTPDSTAHTVEMLAVLVQRGANLFKLYTAHREASALSPQLMHLKGQLLSSVKFLVGGSLAVLEIPPETVEAYKDQFEPYTLVLNEMQWTQGVELAAVFKNYGTKINVPLRSKYGKAAPIAEKFGGGGHLNAAAYRCQSTDVNHEIELLVETYTQFKETADEASQHADA